MVVMGLRIVEVGALRVRLMPRLASCSVGFRWVGSGRPARRCREETAARYTEMVAGARERLSSVAKNATARLLAGRGETP